MSECIGLYQQSLQDSAFNTPEINEVQMMISIIDPILLIFAVPSLDLDICHTIDSSVACGGFAPPRRAHHSEAMLFMVVQGALGG